jgi:mRNA interferase RelE/StbE
MAYGIGIEPAALRQLHKLPRPVQMRVRAAIDALAANPRPSGVVKLEGNPVLYRLRVGDYRVIYEVRDAALRVLVVKVADRKAAYKKKR